MNRATDAYIYNQQDYQGRWISSDSGLRSTCVRVPLPAAIDIVLPISCHYLAGNIISDSLVLAPSRWLFRLALEFGGQNGSSNATLNTLINYQLD